MRYPNKSILIGVLTVVIVVFFMKKETFVTFINPSETQYVKIENIGDECCLNCHINTKGYSNYHNPELIGCISCHLGNPNSFDKEESHNGMV
ncbi:MAG: hypothetical protein JKY73_03900 [Lutibacter sp.]|nr:hypothetical protein [Lutibacter sp.]